MAGEDSGWIDDLGLGRGENMMGEEERSRTFEQILSGFKAKGKRGSDRGNQSQKTEEDIRVRCNSER